MTEVPEHPAELWQCTAPEEISSPQGAFFGRHLQVGSTASGEDGDMRVLLVEKGFPVGADLRVALLE